jgi:S1-C subfamily serine protease
VTDFLLSSVNKYNAAIFYSEVKNMSRSIDNLQVLKSISDATAELVHKLEPSVVNVNSTMTTGTGVVLNSQGYVVTCNHVLGRSASVKIGSGGKLFEAKTIGVDPYSDIALLRTEQKDLKPIEIGNYDQLSPGQFVLALANPFNRQTSVTTGIITNVGATLRGWRGTAMENVIATDARLNPGFSGGPLVDASGKMIGINTAYVWSRGIAIPVNKVKNTTDRLVNGGKIKRAYLGIISTTVPIPEDIASQTGISQDAGVMVFSVEPNSPAKKAGLVMGDVILKFNDAPVTNFYDLPGLLTEDVVQKKAKLHILRGEELIELTIVPSLAKGEADE